MAWSAAVASVGYVYGDDIAEVIDRIGSGIFLTVLALIAWTVLRHRGSRRHA